MKKILISIVLVFISLSLVGCFRLQKKQGKYVFNENYVAVQKDNKWGYYDISGKKVIDFIYDDAYPFVDGVAVVRETDKYYLINTKGNKIIDDGYDFLEMDPEAKAVWYKENDLYGLLNTKGKKITNPIYEKYNRFYIDLAIVKVDGKYGFINRNGRFIIKPFYDEVQNFSFGLALVKKNGYIGVINKQEDTVIDFKYNDGVPLNSSGVLYLIKNNKYYVFNKSGKIILSNLEYCDVSNYYILAKVNKNFYLYDFNGVKIEGFVIEDEQNSSVNKRASLYKNYIIYEKYNDNNQDKIDLDVEVLDRQMKLQMDFSTTFSDDNFEYKLLTHNHMMFFVIFQNQGFTLKGLGLIDGDYHDHIFHDYYNGLFVVSKKGSGTGVFDVYGNIIFPYEHDQISIYQDTIVVCDNNKYSFYNYNGEKLFDDQFDNYRFVNFG
ncbi:MAG TPA: WG repeat-containing protein [Acholeplasmataceae bacterium]|nr:WG repeat-containing protein [Acholeplasmataceae bacterium]